jgi:uncharacterized damage-inducible protein DinB
MLLAEKETTQMSLASLLNNYTAYNLWANQRLVAWLQTKPESLLEAQVPSSFPSLKETLVHIWHTQRFWLTVLKQNPVSAKSAVFTGTNEELFEALVNQSKEFVEYVASLPEWLLQEECYLSTPWFEASRPRFEFIHHCMNHSTYHRGQLVTIGRNLGFTDAPMTDFNFYLFMPR